MTRAPLAKVFITCAITGNITRPDQTPHLPITPQQIADSALEAAEAGAAIAHIHVRDPKTGQPSMELDLYREVRDRIRTKNTDLIINLTTGPGGRFVPSRHDPKIAAEGTTLMAPERRVDHIVALKPDICTLDLNTMNSGGQAVINTPANVRRMAKVIINAGVKPEIELFDSGDIALLHDLVADGTLKEPLLTSFVMGVKYGFQPSPEPYSTRDACCRPTPPSPPSALAARPSPWSPSRTWPAGTCGSALKMPFTSIVACWRPPMRLSSRKRAVSSKISAARSQLPPKREPFSACVKPRHGTPER